MLTEGGGEEERGIEEAVLDFVIALPLSLRGGIGAGDEVAKLNARDAFVDSLGEPLMRQCSGLDRMLDKDPVLGLRPIPV